MTARRGGIDRLQRIDVFLEEELPRFSEASELLGGEVAFGKSERMVGGERPGT